MQLNTNASIVYQLQSNSKYENLSAEKANKSSFEKMMK